jgi:hypothetical protein
VLATKDRIPISVRENPSRYGGGCSAVDLRLTFRQDRILSARNSNLREEVAVDSTEDWREALRWAPRSAIY